MRLRTRHALTPLFAALCAGASAQTTPAPRVLIVPTLSASVDVVDVRGDRGDTGTDVVARVSPGLQLSSRSGRVRGSVDYALDIVARSGDRRGESTLQNRLAATVLAEAVENVAWVDASATITQQPLSPFGQQNAPGSARANANEREVATYVLSPYVRGRLGSAAAFEARLAASGTNTRDSALADSSTTSGSLLLQSDRPGAVFGWNALATQQEVDYRAGRETRTARAIVGVTARPDADWLLSLRGGRESTDVGSIDRRTVDNVGAGVRWTPSPRTTVDLSADKRYFGTGYAASVEHRLQRTVLRYTRTRAPTGGADPTGVGQPLTLYQLFLAQFASVEPDLGRREQLVDAQLQAFGLDRGTVVPGGFVSGAVLLQRRDDLSFAWRGARAGFTVLAFDSESRTLDTTAAVPGVVAPFGVPGTGSVRQSGARLGASYALTPTATLGADASLLKTHGTATQPGNDLISFGVDWTGRIARTATAVIGARWSEFDGAGAAPSYREAALRAAVNLRF